MIFGFFRLFLINMESFRVQCFGPPFPEVFKDSRLIKSLGTFYESLKKYGAKNVKKVIDLHSEYFSIIPGGPKITSDVCRPRETE